MLGLSMGLLITLEGPVLELSVRLLELVSLEGAMLGLPLTMSGEGQTAQYGPTVTDVGSDVLAQAVPSKFEVEYEIGGSMVRQAQRSWLKEDAP
jgi:hypothetical protein